MTITFTKGNQKATLVVNVTIQPQDAKSNSTIINVLDHDVVTGINTGAHTLTVANGKNVGELKAAIEVEDNGTFVVVNDAGTAITDDATAVVTGMVVNVTAEDGVTIIQYTITVQ